MVAGVTKYTTEHFFARCRKVLVELSPVHRDRTPFNHLFRDGGYQPLPDEAREARPKPPPGPPPAPPTSRVHATIRHELPEVSPGRPCPPFRNPPPPMPDILQSRLTKLEADEKRLLLLEDALVQLKKRITRHFESTGVEKASQLNEEMKAALFVPIVNDLRVTLDHLLDVPASAAGPIDQAWKETE